MRIAISAKAGAAAHRGNVDRPSHDRQILLIFTWSNRVYGMCFVSRLQDGTIPIPRRFGRGHRAVRAETSVRPQKKEIARCFFLSISVSLIINFNKALTINLWLISIISFVYKLYNKMIIQWISYFFARILITFLFSDSSSQISFWKHSYWQITFFQRNFTMLAKFNKENALVSDYFEKLFQASIM